MKKSKILIIILIVLIVVVLLSYLSWNFSNKQDINQTNQTIGQENQSLEQNSPQAIEKPEAIQHIQERGYNALLFEETPNKTKDFLKELLSEEYIKEHFVFFSLDTDKTHNILRFFLVYDNYIIDENSYLQWDVPILKGKMRYSGGPVMEDELNIDKNKAEEEMKEKGCDVSNLRLVIYPIDSDYSKIFQCSSCGYLAWKAGGQPHSVLCYKDVCVISATGGRLDIIEIGCSSACSGC